MSKRSIRRRSVRLAKKVWNVVLNNNKDQRKSRSVRFTKISDDSSNDNDGGHTLSVSSNNSSQYEPQNIVGDNPVVESNDEEDVDVSQSMDVENHDAIEENNHDVTELYVHDDTSSVTEKDNSSLPVTAPAHFDESAHEDGGTSKEGSKVESEELLEMLKDNTSCADEGAGTVSQSQGIDQQLCQEEFSEENAFVEGAEVHIIKGTNKGKRGIISRVTSKCAFISIDGFDKDVRKTKSNEFLEIANQKEICCKQHHNSDPQECFLEGNLVQIKEGAHKGCQGIISRTTAKCVFISIRGLSKEIRKKKSAEFLEILNELTQTVHHKILISKHAQRKAVK